jgi:hypothetical protein
MRKWTIKLRRIRREEREAAEVEHCMEEDGRAREQEEQSWSSQFLRESVG